MPPLEQRCAHGFIRSIAPCWSCDGAAVRPGAKETLQRLEPYNFDDLKGQTIAGARVTERVTTVLGKAQWHCVCECGESFIEQGVILRRKEKQGTVACCASCKPKHRKGGSGKSHRAVRSISELPRAPSPVRLVDPARSPMPRWWRIELDEKGNMQSCVAVEHRGEANEKQFLYVLAHNQKEAGRLAWNAYCRLAQIRHRAKITREGKCPWCGRAQDREAGKRCGLCLANDRARAAAAKARKAGEDVAMPDTHQTRAARLAAERAEHRIDVLREVRREVMDRSPREFYGWLDDQIAGIVSGQLTASREAG